MTERRPERGTISVVVDERWMQEWLEYGFAELAVFLAKHAALEAWCVEHHRPRGEP